MLQFARLEETAPAAADAVDASYAAAWRDHFSVESDPAGLVSESNVLRYRPVRRVVVRHAGDRPEALRRLGVAARLSGVELLLSDVREEADEGVRRTAAERRPGPSPRRRAQRYARSSSAATSGTTTLPRRPPAASSC